MKLTDLPAIGAPLPGGTYAGLIHTPEGLHHLVLLDDTPPSRLTWQDAIAWAKSIGADLPSRVEALVFYKHLPSKFEREWHWTNEQHSAVYTWTQLFYHGYQYDSGKKYEGRARAVRRISITPYQEK